MQVKIALKFANYDNTNSPVIEMSTTNTVDELKAKIISVWPQSYSTTPFKDQMRLILMGRLLQDNSATLGACGVTALDYPTPIHVSMTANVVKSPLVGVLTPKKPLSSTEPTERSSPVCCTIL